MLTVNGTEGERAAIRCRRRSAKWPHVIGRDSGEQRGELVAAEPGREVPGTDVVPQRVGDGTERSVSFIMPVLIVDVLELVDIDQ